MRVLVPTVMLVDAVALLASVLVVVLVVVLVTVALLMASIVAALLIAMHCVAVVLLRAMIGVNRRTGDQR